jgi:hypothetical protein
MHFDIAHEFDCDPDEFWTIFFDDAFNREVFSRIRSERQVLESQDDGRTLRRVIRVSLTRDVPAIVQKALDGKLGYIERSTFDKQTKKYDLAIEVPAAGSRFRIGGGFQVDAAGAGRCRRTWAGDAQVKVPLIGGRIEQVIVDNMRKDFDSAAEVLRAWIAKRKGAK